MPNTKQIPENKYISTYLLLALSILCCEVIGGLIAITTKMQHTLWFNSLNKPFWNPPPMMLGVIWLIIYLLLGFSLWYILISKTTSKQKKEAGLSFTIQLALNFLWSFLFYRYQSASLAILAFILFSISIILNIIYFYKISKLSSLLLIPYLLWTIFVTILNFAIWKINN